jgi:hypothetical protein
MGMGNISDVFAKAMHSVFIQFPEELDDKGSQ